MYPAQRNCPSAAMEEKAMPKRLRVPPLVNRAMGVLKTHSVPVVVLLAVVLLEALLDVFIIRRIPCTFPLLWLEWPSI